ncbi:MAG: hypothetical protein J6Y62_00925 [Clostridia bacterium]|nr:hypothetical protein [Clostridia bacterium]
MSQEIAVKVRKRKRKEERKADVTDQGLLLKSNADGYVAPWDSSNIVSHLTSVLKMKEEEARKVVEKVERQVSELGLSVVDSSLIRELVNGNLVEMGYRGKLKDLSVYQIPREFIEEMMYGSKSNENSNIAANNPEAINLSIAELTLKQWALDAVFSEDVKAAHISGMIHIHDLGYPHRVYAFSGDETAVMVKKSNRVEIMTLKELWDSIDAPVERLNETQVRKRASGLEIKDRGKWVWVEQLVMSDESKPGVRIRLRDGSVQAVTAEHGVVVSRNGKFMLVRADEVLSTDKLVKVK